MKFLKPTLATVGVLAVAGALTAFGSPDVTQPRVQDSVTTTFVNLYLDQQRLLGDDQVTADSMAPSTTCDRHNGAVAPVGPGTDWICMITWNDATGTSQEGKFEVQVHSNSCWTASGPAKIVGSFTITDAQGNEVTNPVNAFDGCFDPSS
ncbi:hypothetical protein [Klenkia brasiliensis]|uniref:ABC-2 type transport system permease protein n=1 Tax=Klenkia brasiliensis TaxID=333142 RepID=A0A1G7UQP9_9ACTN|nr:hypothetical protein [Klenkia brasiliensis]SDG49834.1 ABC-2 type transport system permease protein [Klenkia brasiliensis]